MDEPLWRPPVDMPVEQLRIGECIVTRRDLLIATVLGSCVGVTFLDSRTGLAGIFHAMLPDASMGEDADVMPCKYADAAVELVMARFRAADVPPRRIEVKLFGGAFCIEPDKKRRLRSIVDVGAKNVEVVRAALAAWGLKVAGEDTGGDRGRKLFFHTRTGEVWARMLEHTVQHQE